MRIIMAGLLALTLAGCQLSLPFGKEQGAASDAVTPAASTAPAKPAAATPPQAGAAIPAGTLKAPAAPAPAPAPSPAPKAEATAEPAAPPAEKAPPKSPEQLLCEAGGGLWSDAGGKGIKTCVQRTRDAGKSCKRESDCEGLCLARSRSCAPIKPLFGCNDILQADGRQVTLCID